MQRYLCIHGHFYQPPRENPWLEAIELQESAYPYHDWNERITAECYAPNAQSRILDGDGRIVRIVNNYARIAFTILSPHQAQRCKFLGDGEWDDVSGGKIDPSRAYEVRLPSGRSIAVFFYDAPISQAVAFEGLLNSGERFAQRLLKGFDED